MRDTHLSGRRGGTARVQPSVGERPASNASRASSTARSTRSTYRVVARTSEVDESLFGNTKPKGATGKAAKEAQVEKINDGSKYLKGKKPQLKKEEDPTDVVTVTASELQRMRERSVIVRQEDIEAAKAAVQEEKNKTRAVAIARKQKMLAAEEERKKRVPPTESEKVKEEKDQGTLTRAQYMLDEELDDVKHMNQMLLYSKCVTIRDAQIEEKKHIAQEQEEEDRKLDLMMELERIKAIEAYEEREQRRLEDRMRGAAILDKQIEERAQERRRQEELRDQERQQMQAELERMKEEELELQHEKRIAANKLVRETARANAAAIEKKKWLIQAEKEEDARIARYIKEKDERDEAEMERQEAIMAARALETARLRAQQEKAQDKQSEIDELRAVRAAEQYEREWRMKERAEVERVKAINEDLKRARFQQKQSKLAGLAALARQEQEDFYRVIAAQREQEEMERQQAAQQVIIKKKHKDELLNQITHNVEAKAKERQLAIEEGRKLRAADNLKKGYIEKIKTRKINELASMGVPSKYRAELFKYKIADMA